MTYTEKWNEICDYFNRFRTQPEENIQNLWEILFAEIFGYSSLKKEIDSHRQVQLGSTERLIPDIIIKNSETDLFVVELKQGTLLIDTAKKNQLFSYLKQLHIDLGLLVCDKIAIVDYDYNTDDGKQIFAMIDFQKDNPLGAKFVELFSKENFDRSKIKEFINKCVDAKKHIAEIKKELADADLVKKLVTEYFLEKYSAEETAEALKAYVFEVNEKRQTHDTHVMVEGKQEAKHLGKGLPPAPIKLSDESVTIKGEKFRLYRRSDESIQDFVRKTFERLIENSLISDIEIKRLHDAEYCKEYFGIQFSLFVDTERERTIAGHDRYYAKKTANKFFLCNDWWKGKILIYDEKLASWLNAIANDWSKNS